MTAEEIINQARRVHQLTEQMQQPTPILAILVSQEDMDKLVEWCSALQYRDAEPLPKSLKKMYVYGIRIVVDEDL